MGADGFFDLRADAHHGIKGGHRLLENHGDFTSADCAQGAFVECGQIFSPVRAVGICCAGKPNFAGDASPRREQAHQGKSEHGLAAARFTDKTQRLSAFDAQRDVVDGTDAPRCRRQLDSQTAHIEEGGHAVILVRKTETRYTKLCPLSRWGSRINVAPME